MTGRETDSLCGTRRETDFRRRRLKVHQGRTVIRDEFTTGRLLGRDLRVVSTGRRGYI